MNGSNNWIIENLQNALNTWNAKLAEIWQLLTTDPQNFKGGGIWTVIVNINTAVKAIGLALLVLFFCMGVIRTCGSIAEVKRPEHALKLFVRFVIAKAAVTYGMDLMLAVFSIVQGVIGSIMTASGLGGLSGTVLPGELIRLVVSATTVNTVRYLPWKFGVAFAPVNHVIFTATYGKWSGREYEVSTYADNVMFIPQDYLAYIVCHLLYLIPYMAAQLLIYFAMWKLVGRKRASMRGANNPC